MARNQKLTGVLRGRELASSRTEGSLLVLGFHDGSTMTVRVAGPMADVIVGGRVKSVRQRDTLFDLDFEDGTTLELLMAEPTSCVMVRDREGVIEYVD
jgi:hypothetical protein